jgi:hypothetical protein
MWVENKQLVAALLRPQAPGTPTICERTVYLDRFEVL